MKLITFLIIILLNIPIFAQGLDDSQKYHFVEEHNIHRKIVGSPPVRWSDTLEIAAQKQVNLIVANPNSADIDNYYGVNLYRSVKEPTAADILANWVKQQKYYHGEEITEKNKLIYGQYTQVIWAQTVSIGCAMAQTQGEMYYVVCFYNPKGNTIGQKP